MNLTEFFETIAKAKNEVSRRSPDEPDTLVIHPDKAKELGLNGGEIIHGLKVEVPRLSDLAFLGSISGVDPKSAAMWDPECVYILKNNMKHP